MVCCGFDVNVLTRSRYKVVEGGAINRFDIMGNAYLDWRKYREIYYSLEDRKIIFQKAVFETDHPDLNGRIICLGGDESVGPSLIWRRRGARIYLVHEDDGKLFLERYCPELKTSMNVSGIVEEISKKRLKHIIEDYLNPSLKEQLCLEIIAKKSELSQNENLLKRFPKESNYQAKRQELCRKIEDARQEFNNKIREYNERFKVSFENCVFKREKIQPSAESLNEFLKQYNDEDPEENQKLNHLKVEFFKYFDRY